MTKSRTLSKKDDIKQTEALKIYKHFQNDPKSSLILPQGLADELLNHCGFCGKSYSRIDEKTEYFGEKFHKKCVIKMLKGETNR